MRTSGRNRKIAALSAMALGVAALPLAVYAAQSVSHMGRCLDGAWSYHSPRYTAGGEVRWTVSCIAGALRTKARASSSGAATGLAGQGITVRDSAQLQSAIDGARAGATIRLAAGRYAPVTIRGKKYADSPLLIESADPLRPALLTGLIVRDSAGITFRDLAFDATGEKQQYGMLILGSQRIKVDSARFDDPRGLRTTLSAMMIRNSEGVGVKDSRFTRFWHGISLLSGRDIRVEGNQFDNIQTDGIRGGGISNLVIDSNICHAFRPRPKDHPDCIQLWSTQQAKSARNIVISNNLVVRGDGGATQGIFVRDTFRKLPFYDVEITGNMVIGGMYNGVTADGLRQSSVFGNEVIAYKDQKSWIRVAGSDGVKIYDNRAMTFLMSEENGVIDQEYNVTTAWSNSNADERLGQWLAQRPIVRRSGGATLEAILTRYPTAR